MDLGAAAAGTVPDTDSLSPGGFVKGRDELFREALPSSVE
jgi:hypothetical protein